MFKIPNQNLTSVTVDVSYRVFSKSGNDLLLITDLLTEAEEIC